MLKNDSLIISFFFWEQYVHKQGNKCCWNNAGTAEYQLYSSWKLIEDIHIGSYAKAEAQGNRENTDIAGRKRLSCYQLNTADDNRGKHNYCGATQDTLRHD